MYQVKKRENTKKPDRMVLNITLEMSALLIDYALSYSPSPNNLACFRKFLDVLDLESYRYNYDIYNNLLLCKYILSERLDNGITNPILIKESVMNKDVTLKDLCETKVLWKNNNVTGQDASAIAKYIDKKMRFYMYYCEMPKIIETWEKCSKSGFEIDDSEFETLNARVAKLVQIMENTTVATGLLRRFNFSDPNAGDIIVDIARIAQRPSSILQTGIRQLNAVLGPGFRGGKLYTILGFSGKFKSGTLLNLADMIRKFNPQLEEVVDGKRNTILFVTAENTINETIERIFAMYDETGASFLDTPPEEIRDTILNTGKYQILDNDRGIDIELQYFANLEISTADFYRIVDDMESHGQRVICIIADYIKRFRSVFPSNGDETLRMSYVAKEFKTLAEYYNVPVITAQQFNRMGNSIIDSAMKDDKSDLLRLVGSSDIGGAWAVVEESDFVAAINLERHKKDGRLYLSIKCTKNRCGSTDKSVASYFNHPFIDVHEMRLETDLDKEGSLSIMSLATDLESVDFDKLNDAPQRPTIVKSTGASSVLAAIGIPAQ